MSALDSVLVLQTENVFFYSESDNPQLLLNKMVSYLFSRKVLSAFYRSGEEKGDQLLSSLFMHLFFS